MTGRRIALTAAVLAGVVAVGAGVAWDKLRIQPAPLNAAEAADKPAAPADKERDADRDAVRADLKEFVKAFEKGDAKALAGLWTTEGEYVAGDGTTYHGRDAIADAYTQFLVKNPDLKLEATVESIRFVSHDGAVVEGFARSSKGDRFATPASGRFSALCAREDGKWLFAVMREWPDEGVSLRDIDWLIGDWESKGADAEVRMTYEWDETKTRIRGRFTIKRKDGDLSGSQIIGKDPRTGDLRSWLFESDGGFGEAAWTWDGKQWRLEAGGVEADGTETSATNLLTPLDRDSFTWQSIERKVGDEDAADVPPVKVSRIK